MATSTKTNGFPQNHELHITRLLNAPRSLVYEVWTKTEHLINWWSPNGFTVPVCKADFKVGGKLYLEMKTANGTIYPMSGTYKELIEPEKIVFVSAALDPNGKPYFEIENTVLLEDINGKTQLTLSAIVFNAGPEADQFLKGMKQGWNESLNKMENHSSGLFLANPIIMERVLKAPIHKVWQAISVKEHMKKWYFDLADFKAVPGFTFQFEGGKDPKAPYIHLCEVIEVIPEKKISYTWRYKGYQGLSLLSFELFEEGANTRLVLTHAGLHTFPKTNPDLAKENFVEGWTHIIHTSLKQFFEEK